MLDKDKDDDDYTDALLVNLFIFRNGKKFFKPKIKNIAF